MGVGTGMVGLSWRAGLAHPQEVTWRVNRVPRQGGSLDAKEIPAKLVEEVVVAHRPPCGTFLTTNLSLLLTAFEQAHCSSSTESSHETSLGRRKTGLYI